MEDRAEKSEIAYFRNSIDETILEIKALANKKVFKLIFSVKPKISRRGLSICRIKLNKFITLLRTKPRHCITSRSSILGARSNWWEIRSKP